MDVLRILNDRGLVYQLTDEEKLSEALSGGRIPFYIGFDPTAPSLHLGNLVPLMTASWLQKAGHHPLIVVGGATALVGDPSGRSAERTLEDRETIGRWAGSISAQLRRFLDFGPSGALMLDNTSWLLGLDYVGFLRDIGSHFSVNRMLTADSVRTRLEKGLSFLEFNYMILQAYDFLWLYRNQGCRLQIGGADQWGNIVAGIELIRRVEAAEAWGMTCPLVTGSGGEKMSKSMPGGAIWLDPCLTSPYEYYQFWINVDDRDAIYFLKLYTFVPMDEIEKLVSFRGEDIRAVKKRLAWEATAIAHGAEEADGAEAASAALFSGVGDAGAAPSMELPRARLDDGVTWTDLFVETGLCSSRSDVRRLAQQNGLYVGEQRITNPDDRVQSVSGQGGELVLRAGKKRYFRVAFG